MPISAEVRRLDAKWKAKTGWPKWLDWLEIDGIRGWTGQRFSCEFPIMAVVGENGVGKSTILQSAAAIYQPPEEEGPKAKRFASDFFPDTAWDRVTDAEIRFSIREGNRTELGSIRKPGERWRGNPERPVRRVAYIDLSRIQPVLARVGYSRLAKPNNPEVSAAPFDPERLAALTQIMGRPYHLAKISLTKGDKRRTVPVLNVREGAYSGFHGGAGEMTIVEFLKRNLPQTGLVLIDEVETSLHPRAQRRVIRYLAHVCRVHDLQVILTTHSPTILDELPLEARAYVMFADAGRGIVYGTSPEFAMTKMDDVPQTECDVYVEDDRSEAMLTEILAMADPTLVQRCLMIPAGAASVGQALGTMVAEKRFPRPSCVFLDGDQDTARGCANLPGGDAPERVVFAGLRERNWQGVATRVGREFSDVADACTLAMTLTEHHDWCPSAATRLVLGSAILWQAMCAEWVNTVLPRGEATRIAEIVRDCLQGIAPNLDAPVRATLRSRQPEPFKPRAKRRVPNGTLPLFGPVQSDAQG